MTTISGGRPVLQGGRPVFHGGRPVFHGGRPVLHGGLSGLMDVAPSGVERWFAAQGAPPLADLARSGAPALSVGELLMAASDLERQGFFDLSLDYGPGEGSPELRSMLADSAMSGPSECTTVTNGAIEAVLLSCAASLDDRRTVAVATPAYEGILRCAAASGARVVEVPIWSGDGQYLDLTGFDDELIARSSAIVVNTPHNPTGLTIEHDCLALLADRCAEHGTTLIVDEVALATLDSTAQSFSQSQRWMGGDVVTIGDVSKSLGLGGLRIGWLSSADAELVDRVRTLRDLTTLESGAPSQVLATIALRNRCHFAATTIARNNLDALARWVLSVGAQLSPQPCDGLVAFPLLGSAAQQLVDRARSVGVSVMPGDLFGHGGRLRIGLGVDPEVFADALERLGDLIATP